MEEYTDEIRNLLRMALREDIGDGDHSTLGTFPKHVETEAHMILKSPGIIAGISVINELCELYDPTLQLIIDLADGDYGEKDNRLLAMRGKVTSILSLERLSLNILQRMSGIATKTHELSQMIAHTSCKLLDTRKTTPNFRIFEKMAVKIGGGQNHRFGLNDMVMLKDNHIDFAGGISNAVKQISEYLHKNGLSLKIEVETRNLDEVREALQFGQIDTIMLDNMSIDEMKKAVEVVNKKCKLEASGGITESNLVSVAETGVDYVSMGALTHSYQSLDISLKAKI